MARNQLLPCSDGNSNTFAQYTHADNRRKNFRNHCTKTHKKATGLAIPHAALWLHTPSPLAEFAISEMEKVSVNASAVLIHSSSSSRIYQINVRTTNIRILKLIYKQKSE
jgi:hypothetical protein